jgi:hypothetical protein
MTENAEHDEADATARPGVWTLDGGRRLSLNGIPLAIIARAPANEFGRFNLTPAGIDRLARAIVDALNKES